MKKLLFTLVLLFSSVVVNAQTFKLGDVNKDGQVTIADVMMVVDIVMNGYKPLTLSSDNVVVDYGSSAAVNIFSGYGPYDIACSDENIVGVSLNGTFLNIMGKAAGTAVVTVTDTATGYTKDINVTVNAEPLTISNNTVEVTAGESATVEITSGSGNYSVKSSDASVATATVSNGIVTVISLAGGTATITVTDKQSGQTATIEVTVAHLPLALSSNSLTLSIGDEGSVNITSGSGNYSVESSDDNVVFAELDGNAVSILAFGGGSATVTVTDTQSGQTATINVTVDYLPLELSASSLTLTVGEESTASITSGNGFFTVRSSDTGVATASLSGTSIKVTAVAAGTATITVTDRRSGQTSTIEITVNENQTTSLCPDDHHPHLIDLGLPSGTKWACCNVDTDHPEKQSPANYGGYYAWGETETKSTYDWSTYIHCDGSYDTCHDLGSDIAGTQYDVAHMKWGGSWVMPSKEQQDELRSNCTYEWTIMYGVEGGKYTSNINGGSIFLPAADDRWPDGPDLVGDFGLYWSSTRLPSYSRFAYSLHFNSVDTNCDDSNGRGVGQSVRPVVRNFMPLNLSSSSLTLTLGEESTVNITSGNGFFTVRSSDTSIATTSLSGSSIKVTAVAVGIATITVTDTQSGQTATIEVTVNENQTASFCPDDHHPHLIDLGLPSGTKWACCNVGANKPEAYGGYYAWGETEEKSTYDWNTYIHCDGSWEDCHNLGSDIAGTQYDVAHVKWGGSWVMPSLDQIDELVNNCSYTWITMNGVTGGKYTSNINGGSIFLPAAGRRDYSGLYGAGSGVNYWSSTQYPSYSYRAYDLVFYSDSTCADDDFTRDYGRSVRPVVGN